MLAWIDLSKGRSDCFLCVKEDIHVLMLEDVPADADIITNALRQGELNVQVNRVDTREAFERALEEPTDLIISDHGVPAFDSLSALSLARAKLPKVPFIAVSGTASDPKAREILRRGATGYVDKSQLPSLAPQVKQVLQLAEVENERKRLSNELAETADRFNLLQEGTRENAIFLLDADGRIKWWNAGGRNIYGYEPQEVLNQDFSCLFSTEEGFLPRELLETTRAQEGVRQEAWSLRRDGSRFRSALTLTASRTAAGEVRGYAVVARDLTELQQTTKALKQSEARQHAMLQLAQDAFISIDERGILKDWDGAAEKIFYYTREQAIGREFVDLIIPASMREQLRSHLQTYLKSKGRERLLGRWYSMMRADGSEVPIEFAIAPTNVDGATRFSGYIHDLSRLKETEAALHESQERYRLIIDNIADYAIYMLDAQGNVASWNEGAKYIQGYESDEVIGRHFSIFFTPEDRQQELPRRELERATKEGQSNSDAWSIRKDGSRFRSHWTLTAVREGSQLVGFARLAHDITEKYKAEQALRESEEQLRMVLQSARDYAIFTIGLDGRIKSWNRGAEKIFGFSNAEALQMEFKSLYLEEWVANGHPDNELQIALQNIRGNECWYRRKGGGRFWGSGHTMPLTDVRGQTRGYLKIVRDETSRRLMQMEIQAHVRQQSALARFSQRALAVEDLPALAQDAVTLVSETLGLEMCTWLEFVPQQNAFCPRQAVGWGAEIATIAPVCTRAESQAGYTLMINAPVVVNDLSTETRFHVPQALRDRGVNSSISVVVPGEPNPCGVMVAHGIGPRDFSEPDVHFMESVANVLSHTIRRKRAESELAETERRFRLAVEAVQDYAIYTLDEEGRVAAYNLGATRLEGYQPEEIIGRPLHIFFPPEDVARGIPERELERARTEGKSQTEGWNVRKDGTRFISNWLLTAIRDADGNLTGYSKVARDVTEIRRAKEQMETWHEALTKRVAERTQELQASNEELEAFSYSVSHDLRAPLRHINSYIEMLEEELGTDISSTAKSHLRLVAQSAMQMARLVDDLLKFSRMGREEMRRVPVRLGVLVQEAQQHFQTELAERNVEWVISDCPEVMGDPASLRQVFINLLSNALKYTRSRPRPRIEIGCEETPTEIICYVRDNGVGFDMQYAEKLFGVFERLHSSNQFEGTGIGLAIVRRIIQRHGGRTWAEAEVDRGATFYLSLPKEQPSTPEET
jgi:PAS domain S-box-containing protein